MYLLWSLRKWPLYLYRKSDPAFPLTVFSFVCPGKGYLLPFQATIKFAWPYALFSHSIGSPSISASVQPSAVSSALSCTDHRAWLQSIEIHKFYLMELLMPLSCIKLYTLYRLYSHQLQSVSRPVFIPAWFVRESSSMSFGYSPYWISLGLNTLG